MALELSFALYLILGLLCICQKILDQFKKHECKLYLGTGNDQNKHGPCVYDPCSDNHRRTITKLCCLLLTTKASSFVDMHSALKACWTESITEHIKVTKFIMDCEN